MHLPHRRSVVRSFAVATLLSAAVSGCGGAGQAPPSASAPPAPASPAPSPSGPTTFTSTAFDQPFAVTLPAGWIVGDQAADMAAFFLPMGPDEGPRLGLDVQEVSKVQKDPCDTGSSDVDPGATPAKLATWMSSWKPLHASKPVAAKVGAIDALAIDEGFDGSPCANANLWPTSGGYLDPAEHKRYFILEVGGKRVVVTLVGRDDTWGATLPDGQSVLDSLTFAKP